MNDKEAPISIHDLVLQALNEYRDAPPIPGEEAVVNDTRETAIEHEKRAQITALQEQYRDQLRETRFSQNWLVEAMAKQVAWTWLPGRDRRVCPGIVDIHDARLLTMDRFPSEAGRIGDRCALTLYRITIDRPVRVCYGGSDNIAMLKDFSIRPHYGAGGLALDARNTEIFYHALALDQAMQAAAMGDAALVKSFEPPPVLLGFAHNYTPLPEWRGPMQEVILRMLRPEAPHLRCLLSPGGLVQGLHEKDGFRIVDIQREGDMVQVRMPTWTILDSNCYCGNVVHEGQPLADLPRERYETIQDVTSRFPYRSLEWLEQRILDENTEMVSVEESVHDKRTGQRHNVMTTWRCVPLFLVSRQIGRARRFFLDLRRHLGRRVYSISSPDRYTTDICPTQARVDVMAFDAQPTVTDLQFGDGKNWIADLMSQPPHAAWKDKLGLRK